MWCVLSPEDQAFRDSAPCLSCATTSRRAPNWSSEEAHLTNIILNQSYRCPVSTDRLNREDVQLAASLEGESGPTPAGKTLPRSYPKTRFRRERAGGRWKCFNVGRDASHLLLLILPGRVTFQCCTFSDTVNKLVQSLQSTKRAITHATPKLYFIVTIVFTHMQHRCGLVVHYASVPRPKIWCSCEAQKQTYSAAGSVCKSEVESSRAVWSHMTYSKGKDQPGKVDNHARGQVNRDNEYFPVSVRA